jgi:hypothetical protein
MLISRRSAGQGVSMRSVGWFVLVVGFESRRADSRKSIRARVFAGVILIPMI